MNTQTAATETPAQPSIAILEHMARQGPVSDAIVRLQSFKIGDGPSDSALHVDGVAYGQYVSPKNPGPNPNAVHPWERCGLGVAPYRCVGSAVVTYQACHGAPVQPGSSCDYCGQGIMNVYSVQAACKSVFKVGCDCVRKTCSEKEGVRTAIETADRKHRNALAKAARGKRDAVAKDALATLRAEHEFALAAMPHPRAATQDWAKDKTALDWLDFMLGCCGAAGRAKLLKEARALLAGR